MPLTLTAVSPGALHLTAPYGLTQISVYNVKDYGAVGDGAADDTTAIQDALAAAPTASAGAASGAIVYLPAGTFLIKSPLSIPAGVRLVGVSTEATYIKAATSFSGSAMITNSATDGTQQDAYIELLTVHGNSANGAVSGDGILFDSLFVNTYIRNVKVRYCSGYGIHWKTTAAVGFGQAVMDTVECDHNSLDQILIEGAFNGLDLSNLDVEHFASGYHGLHLKGVHNASGAAWVASIRNLYVENDITNAAGVWIEGCSAIDVGQMFMGGTEQTGQAAVRITGTNQWSSNAADGSKGITVQKIFALRNSGAVLVDDQTRGTQILSQGNPSVMPTPYNTETPLIHNVGGTNEPAFQNSAANNAASLGVVRFWKTADNLVHVEGAVGAINTGLTIFTLPAGFRPSASQIFMGNDSVGNFPISIQVDSNGNVYRKQGSNLATWATLNCSFLADG